MYLATCSLPSLALDWPCAAAMLSQAYAVTSSSGTPLPLSYLTPRWLVGHCAALHSGIVLPPLLRLQPEHSG